MKNLLLLIAMLIASSHAFSAHLVQCSNEQGDSLEGSFSIVGPQRSNESEFATPVKGEIIYSLQGMKGTFSSLSSLVQLARNSQNWEIVFQKLNDGNIDSLYLMKENGKTKAHVAISFFFGEIEAEFDCK